MKTREKFTYVTLPVAGESGSVSDVPFQILDVDRTEVVTPTYWTHGLTKLELGVTLQPYFELDSVDDRAFRTGEMQIYALEDPPQLDIIVLLWRCFV